MKFPRFGLILKFGLALSLLIIFTSSLLTFFLILSERVRVTSDLKDKGYTLARNIAYSSERAVVNNDNSFLQILLNGLKSEKDLVYVQIINTKGSMLAQVLGSQANRSSVFNIDIPIESVILPKLSEKEIRGPWSKASETKLVGEVKLGISLSKVNDTTAQISQVIFGITLGIVIFGVAGVFILTRVFLVRPMEKLAVGTHKVSEGDLTYSIKISSYDEIGALAESFNKMTVDLKKAKEIVEAHSQILEEKVKERTKELEDAMNKLKIVDKMKTEFLSVVSHELKTPLTPIVEYTSLLLEKILGPLEARQEEALGKIRRQANHLNNLIETVLDVSRLETGRPFAIKKELVSLHKILAEVEEAMQIDIEKKELVYEKDIPADTPTIYADGSSLKRLILNLIGNAIKFTPMGGKIRISASEEAGSLQVCVKDTGIGISIGNLKNIFDKFFQVDSSYTREAGGIGMGLAIAKGIVESHRGKIWAESTGLGHGTTICFVIPLE